MSNLEHKLLKAHKRSSQHRVELESSSIGRCFYCLESFNPSTIEEWVDDQQTALCPRCGIDSVIGAASGVPLTDEFFKQMRYYWFDR